jgi:hypothetical protein
MVPVSALITVKEICCNNRAPGHLDPLDWILDTGYTLRAPRLVDTGPGGYPDTRDTGKLITGSTQIRNTGDVIKSGPEFFFFFFNTETQY